MRSVTAAFAAVLLVLAGCTGSSADVEADPEGALRDAIEAIADYDGVEVTLSATGDAEALVDDPADAEAAELLFTSQIVLRATGESEEDAQVELIIDLDGAEVFELRVLPGTRVFVRADLDALADAVDDPSLTANLDDLVASAQEFGLGDVAEVALAGEWIELTGFEQMMELAEGFGAGMGVPEEEPDEEELEEMQERIVATFDRFVEDDVTVTYVGSEDAGERVQATATGEALERLFREITTITAEISGVDPAMLGDLDTDVPSDESFTLDLWLDGGELSQIGIDLAAFDDSGDIPADTFVLIGLAEFTGGVEPPAEAEPFDLFGLISGFLFGGFGDLEDLEGLDELEGLDDVEGLDELDDEDLVLECVPEEEVEEFGLEALVEEGVLEVC